MGRRRHTGEKSIAANGGVPVRFSEKQRLAMSWWSRPETRTLDACICDGAVRSGKTFSMSLGFAAWAMSCFQEQNFAICGKTITAVKRNVVTPLLRALGSLGFLCVEKARENYVELRLGGVRNRFYLFGGRDAGSASLIQGMTLAGVLLDEVALMPRDFVEQALARCSVSGSKLWFNCNPEGPMHWFYREWIQKTEEKRALYLHFTMEDNPALTPEVRARYARLYSGPFYDRFVLGKWTAAEGLVYPMFSEARHVVAPENLPVCTTFYLSCDYGTVNPSSFGLWGYADGIWYRLREYYYDAVREGARRTDEEHYAALEALAEGVPITAVIVDPSAASFMTCIQRHGVFRVLPGDNDVTAGIQAVSRMLQEGTLRFSAACTDLLREFSQYVWSDSIRGDVPRKEHDHAMDDMRYFVQTVASKPQDARFVYTVPRRNA